MTAPAASLRGGAVGALTVALAVAAHGSAGGGYPSGSALMFLLVVGVGVGALATMPAPGMVRLLGGLMIGQFAAHLALAAGSPQEMTHDHSVLPSASMLAFHLAASTVAAVLVCTAERLYGPITSIVRAVLDPPLPLPDASAGGYVGAVGFELSPQHRFTTSISRRGPPNSQR